MPVSLKIDPFSLQPIRPNITSLRTPAARVLAPLVPDHPEDPVSEWPVVNRAQLAIRAGYTAISGTVTRALNGIRPGSKSGAPHVGLLARGFLEEVILDIMGTPEVNYRITAAGICAYRAFLADNGGKLPSVKERDTCINERYQKPSA